jgi:7-cyano-7-deazaguanine tRNA-ribosyltransferase
LFETKTRDLGGRIGKLATRHGYLETPFLFPVVDPTRQTPSLEVLKQLRFNGFITNAYLFYKRNKGVAKKIHREFQWNNVIMTDSGGYQVLVYGGVEVDNKTIVSYEKEIETDIAVILDIPTGTRMTYSEALDAVEETYRRGIEALPWIIDSDQLWVYPVQGAPYRELLVKAAIQARRLPYDIYAVGSPTVMLEKYKYSKLVELVVTARMILPPSKPIHVFGVGHPMIIPFLVAAGGDLFDSASYILYARDGRYMLETGTKHIRDLEYFPCNCPVCSRYTPRELLEMPENKRVELLALHNLYVLAREIKTVKQAIKEGRLWELLEYRSRAHPSLYEAFNVLKKYAHYLEKYSPRVNPGGKALLVNTFESLVNPKASVNIDRSIEIAKSRVRGRHVVLIPAYKKPYNQQVEFEKIRDLIGERGDVVVLFIHPYFGLMTPGVASTYPFYQHEARLTKKSIKPRRIAELIEKILDSGASSIIIVETSWFSKKLFESTKTLLGYSDSEKVTICSLDEISSRLPP